MTEPDEAKQYAQSRIHPEMNASVAAPIKDELAMAYRAGQAASAERIGNLRGALGVLIYEVEKDGHDGSHLGDDGPSACGLCETVANIRALLKEADQ
jgi:hypothetical protein